MMSVRCFASYCSHNNLRETCRFFIFPKDKLERDKWKKMIGSDREPGACSYLCSCHFRDGERENGPELFGKQSDHQIAPIKFEVEPVSEMDEDDLRVMKLPDSNLSVAERPEFVLGLDEPADFALGLAGPPHSVLSVKDFSANVKVKVVPRIFLRQTDTSATTQTEVVECAGPSRFTGMSTSVTKTEQNPEENSPTETLQSKRFKIMESSSSVIAEAENYLLKGDLERMKQKLEKLSALTFSFEHIKNKEDLILLYTGLPNAKTFLDLYKLVENVKINYYYKWKVGKISKEDQLFLCLMKLRQDFPHADLAFRFSVSQATVSNIVVTWLLVLHEILFKPLVATVQSRVKNKTCLPSCFSTFTNCQINFNCTQAKTVTSKASVSTEKITNSSFKRNKTWKALIGVASNGAVTFVSELYPGSTSDKQVIEDCGVLDLLQTGDLVLADKGFLLRDILPAGVHINKPPFLTTPQFTPEQVRQAESVAKARIHIEKVIRRCKSYKILESVPTQYIQHVNAIIQVVGALTNLDLECPLIEEN